MISSLFSKTNLLFCGLITLLGIFGYQSLPGGIKNATLTPTPTATRMVTPSPTLDPFFSGQDTMNEQAVISPTPASASSIPFYQLRMEFDPRFNFGTIHEKIVYYNHTGQELNTIKLLVEANHSAGVFSLKKLTGEDGATLIPFHLEDNILDVNLPQVLSPDKQVALNLDYTLKLPEKSLPLGYTGHQANFIDWYPYIPPYQADKGWEINPAGRVGEHLSYDLADFEVEIRFPDKTPSQVIAAPTAEQAAGNGIKKFTHLSARNFYLSISPLYKIVSQQVGDVTINGYVFPEHLESGNSALGYTANALSYFSSIFTPYQHKTFSFVEADFADGMEGDGIFFLNKNYFAYTDGPKSGLCALSAHETAHQWWFAQVTNNPAINPWMDESLATYSELIYYRKWYPDLTDWWWQYRVFAFKPVGNIAGTIYDFQSYRPYVNAVYLHGVVFLDAVYQKMGQDAFITFLKQYAQTYSGKQVTPDEFFNLLSQQSQVNLQPIISENFKK
jgi:hypothetical protein